MFRSAYLTGGQVWLAEYFLNSKTEIDIVPQIKDAGLVGKRYHFIPE